MQIVTDPGTAVHRQIAGDNAAWRLSEVLTSRLVNAAEYSNFLAYQMNKGKDAPDWPTPVPVYPPWVTPAVEEPEPIHTGQVGERTEPGKRRIGNRRMSIDEAKKWLGW